MGHETLFITLLVAVLPTVFSARVLKRMEKRDIKDEKRETARKKENVLILKSIDATGTLSEITALCYKDSRKPNGDLDEAIRIRKEIKNALREHLYEEHEEMKTW